VEYDCIFIGYSGLDLGLGTLWGVAGDGWT